MYIREAHPAGESRRAPPRPGAIPGGGGVGAAPLAQTEEDRHAAAQRCVDGLGLTLPTVVDGLDNAANLAYGAWPDRLFIIGTDGNVAFRGEPGPRGFSPDAMEAALEATLAAKPASTGAPDTP